MALSVRGVAVKKQSAKATDRAVGRPGFFFRQALWLRGFIYCASVYAPRVS
jgi:hypothetical protein